VSAQSNAQRLNVALAAGLADWLDGVRVEGERLYDEAGRNFTGATRSGLYSEAQTTADGAEGAVGSRSPHAYFVHEGRGPGKPPPYEPIRRWVEGKLGVADRLVFVVTQRVRLKIARFGTKGTPFLQEPFDRRTPDLVPTLSQSIDRAFEGAALLEVAR